MVYHWSFSDCKSSQVSRTLLTILANLNKAVILMVSVPPPISKSSSPCRNPLVTAPSVPVTIGITVTFMFHSFFFSPLARSRYLSFFSISFSFSAGSLFCCCWFSLGLVVWLILGDPFASQHPREFCVSYFPGRILRRAYTICPYVKFKLFAQFPVDHLLHPVMSSFLFSLR